MGAYICFIGYGVPAIILIILILTPRSRRWLQKKGFL